MPERAEACQSQDGRRPGAGEPADRRQRVPALAHAGPEPSPEGQPLIAGGLGQLAAHLNLPLDVVGTLGSRKEQRRRQGRRHSRALPAKLAQARPAAAAVGEMALEARRLGIVERVVGVIGELPREPRAAASARQLVRERRESGAPVGQPSLHCQRGDPQHLGDLGPAEAARAQREAAGLDGMKLAEGLERCVTTT